MVLVSATSFNHFCTSSLGWSWRKFNSNLSSFDFKNMKFLHMKIKENIKAFFFNYVHSFIVENNDRVITKILFLLNMNWNMLFSSLSYLFLSKPVFTSQTQFECLFSSTWKFNFNGNRKFIYLIKNIRKG